MPSPQQPPGYPATAHCGDCGVPEGALHAHFPICDQEMCPVCLGQLLSCACQEQIMTPRQHAQWLARVRKAGRIPFVQFPDLCARCGHQWPDYFTVPDAEWQQVVPPSHWNAVLCRPCYDALAALRRPPVRQQGSGKKGPLL